MGTALCCLAMLSSLVLPAAAGTPGRETDAEIASRIWLWPGELAPGSAAVNGRQAIEERSDDPAHPDRVVTGVSRPYMTVHRPAHPNGRALLVLPGGGYARVVLDKEGSALVPELVDDGGLTLFVLRYRLPGDGHEDDAGASLADAQRALRIVRARAGEWGIDGEMIAVLGFSAGGHLAARLATAFDTDAYAPVDAIDERSARPDMLLLAYPVIDMGAATRCAAAADAKSRAGRDCTDRTPVFHAGSRDRLLGPAPSADAIAAQSLQRRVRPDMPPVFLLHANDDGVVAVDNTLLFAAALRRAGVPHQMHLFPEGGHGFGTRAAHGPLAAWPRLALDWIESMTAR